MTLLLSLWAGVASGFTANLFVWWVVIGGLGVKPSFWRGFIINGAGLMVGIFAFAMATGFFSLAENNQIVVLPPSVVDAKQQRAQEMEERLALKEQNLNQVWCFTWGMLDQGFKTEQIMVTLNTMYQLEMVGDLTLFDIGDALVTCEEAKAAWDANKQRPSRQAPCVCTPKTLFERNKALRKGAGLTQTKPTRTWLTNLRRTVYWLSTAQGFNVWGFGTKSISALWPDNWFKEKPEISSHVLEDICFLPCYLNDYWCYED